MTAPDVTTSDTPPGCVPGGEWISLAPYGFPKYEAWSPGGYGLAEDQWPIRRQIAGTRLKVTLGTHGYPQVKPYNDQGKQKTLTVHGLIMLANVGPPKPGQETRHLNSDPLDYRWAPGGTDEEIKAAGGNLVYGTKPQNHADQVKAGTAVLPPPTFPCVMPLKAVTRKLGYTNEVHVHALARQYGGYKGSLEQARTQCRPSLMRRVLGRFARVGGQ
jgi:hypothetical protein